MKRSRKSWLIFGNLALLLVIIAFPFHHWARQHVDYMTAVKDHPLNCISCHLYTSKNKLIVKMINEQYLSPYSLVVSKDGKTLYVVAQESDALLVVDASRGKVLAKVRVGVHPHSVVIDNTGRKAYVSDEWSDNVLGIDLGNNKVVDTLLTGNGPAGLALSPDGQYLYVVNSLSSDISIFDLHSGQEISRLPAGNNPAGICTSPDGKSLLVTSRRALIKPYGSEIETELTELNGETRRVEDHRNFESAYMMENVAYTPSGDLAVTPLIRSKNLLPTVQVEKGWMMTEGIGILETKPNGRMVQLLLDEPGEYFPDPFGIAISPDSKRAYVTHAGVDFISVIDLDSIRNMLRHTPDNVLKSYANNLGIFSRFVIARIPTGANPKGIAVSPDGKYLYVAEMMDDKIGVINTENLQNLAAIDLGGPKRITVARHGRRLFNNASHTFQYEYSCYTCHPDEHEDGLVYNMSPIGMGRNVTNTLSLRDIGDTPPYKWVGTNQSVYKQDGMRFSTVLTRTEAFNYKDLDAMVAYIMRGIKNPPNLMYNPHGELTDAQLRGKAIFDRIKDNTGKEIPYANRCSTCHPSPLYTNKKLASVGTLAVSDDSTKFDTPSLFNLFASAPYLHDGRALTLEEIWTKYGREDLHGVVNDLTKNQLNDLIGYLKSLRDPEYLTHAKAQNASLIH